MKKQSIRDFLKDPLVKEAMKEDGPLEVARMAFMAGNLSKDQDLREFAQRLMDKHAKAK